MTRLLHYLTHTEHGAPCFGWAPAGPLMLVCAVAWAVWVACG